MAAQEDRIQLIAFDQSTHSFALTAEGAQFLTDIKTPLSVVSVVGKIKTGKTFLIHRILMDKKGAISGVGHSQRATTKGIWLQRDLLTVEGNESKILIVDSEGLGSPENDANYDARIFCLAMLMSSLLVFNSIGPVDEASLEGFEFVSQLAKEIKTDDGTKTSIQLFPALLWVLRDFSLRLEDVSGKKISAAQYLDNCLELSKGVNEAIEKRNRVRRVIKHFFDNRDCFTLVRPAITEFEMQRLDKLKNSEFRPEFVDQFKKLRSRVLKSVDIKYVSKSPATGPVLLAFLEAVLAALNSNRALVLPSIHTSVLNTLITNALNKFQLALKTAELLDQSIIDSAVLDWPNQKEKQKTIAQLKELFDSEVKRRLEKPPASTTSKPATQLKDLITSKEDASDKPESPTTSPSKKVTIKPRRRRTAEKRREPTGLTPITETSSAEERISDRSLGSIDTEQPSPKQSANLAGIKATKSIQEIRSLISRFNQNDRLLSEAIVSAITRLTANECGDMLETMTKKMTEREEQNRKLIDEIHHENDKLNTRLADADRDRKELEKLLQDFKEKELNKWNGVSQILEDIQQKDSQDSQQSSLEKQLLAREQEVIYMKKQIEGLLLNIDELRDDKKKLYSELFAARDKIDLLQQPQPEAPALPPCSKPEASDKTQMTDPVEPEVRVQKVPTPDPDTLRQLEQLQSENGRLRRQAAELSAARDEIALMMEKEVQERDFKFDELKKSSSSTIKNLEEQVDSMVSLRDAQTRNISDAMERYDQLQSELSNHQAALEKCSWVICSSCCIKFKFNVFLDHHATCDKQYSEHNSSILTLTNHPRFTGDPCLVNLQLTSVDVKENNENKRLFVDYGLTCARGEKSWEVTLKYKDFVDLFNCLKDSYPDAFSKKVRDHFSVVKGRETSIQSTMDDRRKLIQDFLNEISKHPLLCSLDLVKITLKEPVEDFDFDYTKRHSQADLSRKHADDLSFNIYNERERDLDRSQSKKKVVSPTQRKKSNPQAPNLGSSSSIRLKDLTKDSTQKPTHTSFVSKKKPATSSVTLFDSKLISASKLTLTKYRK